MVVEIAMDRRSEGIVRVAPRLEQRPPRNFLARYVRSRLFAVVYIAIVVGAFACLATRWLTEPFPVAVSPTLTRGWFYVPVRMSEWQRFRPVEWSVHTASGSRKMVALCSEDRRVGLHADSFSKCLAACELNDEIAVRRHLANPYNSALPPHYLLVHARVEFTLTTGTSDTHLSHKDERWEMRVQDVYETRPVWDAITGPRWILRGFVQGLWWRLSSALFG